MKLVNLILIYLEFKMAETLHGLLDKHCWLHIAFITLYQTKLLKKTPRKFQQVRL